MGAAGDEHDDEPTDPDEPDEPVGAPPDPLDRVWVHPAELPRLPSRPRRRVDWASWLRPAAAGAIGALAVVAVMLALGVLDDDDASSPAATARTPVGTDDAVRAARAGALGGGIVLVTVRDEAGARHVSGICLRHAGEVLTSARALGTSTQVTVTTADGSVLVATVVGRDPATDIALLAVDRPLPAVPIAERDPGVGEPVWVLGAPGANGQAWISEGIVASTDALVAADPGPTFGGLLETDALTTPATAGGALLDRDGNVVGIVLGPVGTGRGAFAVPMAVAVAVAQDLRTDGVAVHGALGVVGVDSPFGPIVAEVMPDSAAARAGIEPGDLVTSIEGRAVLDMGGLTAMVRRYGPGKTVTVALVRDGTPMELTVRLATTAAEPA